MNNRYLFKAKRENWKELSKEEWWVVGYYLFYDNTHIIIVSDKSHIEYIEIDSSTICQCTGLKDKEGNLIWENDIIEKEFYTDFDAYANSEKYVGKIIYDSGAWSALATRNGITNINILLAHELEFTDFENHCSVIGNIFDNPELLEVE